MTLKNGKSNGKLNNQADTQKPQFYSDQAWSKQNEHFALKHFFKQHQQSAPQQNDIVVWVKQAHHLAGALRLVRLENISKHDLDTDNRNENNQEANALPNALPNNSSNVFWLRGLFIAPDCRGQGLASALLHFAFNEQLQPQNTQPSKKIIAFAPPHLHNFYLQNGYLPHNSHTLPQPLKTRYTHAQQQGKTWLCLVRNG
ncbi:GNAT family N-acetyltransferase [Thiomicrorhabdus aquaedulcis]|uniref:GNAT family N-acetyltransferase n=1 Tax=Thiomicrorhabdus aquaedulcis TaxID=2211106 RepID=UPI000FDC19B0|nr:GNAT family N-acetyltransferase [Thiomicrorhabdus aquaedulcis]